MRFLQLRILVLILLFSCHAKDKQKVDLNSFDFTTSDATELFFKNIRESYYQKEERDGINIYRLKEYQEMNVSFFEPMIVHHWRTDKAYLLLDFNEKINTDEIFISSDSIINTYQINQVKDHLNLAYDLYQMNLDNKKAIIKLDNEQMDVFKDSKEKSNFSLVLYDYFRFTNKF